MHWSVKYLGIPWQTGGRNLRCEGLDCWGLLRYVYDHEFNLLLPEYPAPCGELAVASILQEEQLGGGAWTLVTDPIDGDGVALGKDGTFNHVGVLVKDPDNIYVLHAIRKSTSACTPLRHLASRGWNTIAFYRHALRLHV